MILCCFAYAGQSQVSLNYFSDSEVRLGTNVYQHIKSGSNIIIGGQTLKNSLTLQPFVAKVDTAGNILWNSVDNDPDSYASLAINWSVVEMRQMGNYIYALVKSNTTNSNGGHKELWRVDANNGAILYKKLLSSSHYYKICGLEDFDATRFILYYYPNVGQPKVGFVRKSDGQGIGQLSVPSTSGNVAFHLATDKSQNIYYSLKDSIYKRSSGDLNTVAWRTALPATICSII